ncbi:MAG: helix-turn-helix domain-containing protein [Phycisphaerae bacterium]
MQGRRTALIVRIDDATRSLLQSWLRATKTPQGLAKRARAMLLLADGQSYAATARQVSMRERHVRKWAKRFLRDGPDGLSDAPRSGRPPVFSPRGGDPSGQDRLRIAG